MRPRGITRLCRRCVMTRYGIPALAAVALIAGAAPQFSYPAPGNYGSTSFRPYTIPPLSGRLTDPLADLPDEWPGVGPARITVKVPAGAKLFVDGRPTKQTGAVRQFVTPPTL